MAHQIRIGFLVFDGIEALDLFGPLECFAAARLEGRCPYETTLIGLDGPMFVSESGITLSAHTEASVGGEWDILIVPGGRGLREPQRLERAAVWLRDQAESAGRVASVCTGLYALAHSTLVDGRRATTHWRFSTDIATSYPALELEPDAIFVRDGKFWSSAGITAGIDLALAMIEDDFGPAVSLAVARELVVYLKRPGGQGQFSDRLTLQTQAHGRLADLAAWMITNLDKDLSIDSLSARTGLSRRHFTRLFKGTFGASPTQQIERLRMDEARVRLENTRQGVQSIASSMGYGSTDAFSRAFERRWGLRPAAYREHFSTLTVTT